MMYTYIYIYIYIYVYKAGPLQDGASVEVSLSVWYLVSAAQVSLGGFAGALPFLLLLMATAVSRRRKRGKSKPLLADLSGVDADRVSGAVGSVQAAGADVISAAASVDAAASVAADGAANAAPFTQVSVTDANVDAGILVGDGAVAGSATHVSQVGAVRDAAASSIQVGNDMTSVAPLVPQPALCRCGGCHSQQGRPQSAFRCVHTFCFPDILGRGRRRPASFTREQFGVLLKRRHGDHFSDVYEVGNVGVIETNKVEDIFVCRELHANGQPHLYAVVICARPYHATRISKRIRDHDQVYLSHSSSHAYFWTAITYCAVPSAHKAPCEIDKAPWDLKGKTVRELLLDFPRGARASEKQRVMAYMGLPGVGQKCKPPTALLPEELAARIRLTVDGLGG